VVVALAVLATSVTASAGDVASAPPPSAVPPTGAAAPVTGDPAVVAEGLRTVGFAVVDDPAAGAGRGVIVTTRQLEAMAAEVAGGSGMLGAELDAVTPMPAGAPPFSYLVAAWVHDALTPRAQLARSWYPADTAFGQAPSLLIPRAVLLMFVADVAEQVDAAAPPLAPEEAFVVPLPTSPMSPTSLPTAASTSVAGFRTSQVGEACGVVSGFLTVQVASLFQMLRIRADFLGTGPLEVLGSVLSTIWNTAITLAGDAVSGLVRNLGAPVLEAIGRAIAIGGIVSQISSYISGWNISLSASPVVVAFPTAPAAPATGRFAVSDASARPWQADLEQCAVAFGIDVPRVLEPGSEVTWQIERNSGLPDGLTPLLTTTFKTDVIPSEGPAYLDYTTGQNDPEATDPGWGYVTVTATVARSELNKVLEMARRLVTELIGQVVSVAIPVPALAQPVRDNLNALLQPLLDQLASAISAGTSSAMQMSGRAQVFVTYLRVRDPDPTPAVSPPPGQPGSGGGDFCAKLVELYPLDAPLMDWPAMGAAGIAAIGQLSPLAPAELSDEMGVMMQMYQAATTASGLPNEAVLAVAEPFANAALTVVAYCGLDPSEMMPAG
jgi:hypothetical protein